jgi:hypothetical protein
VERNRKAGQKPPRVVAPTEEEEKEDDDDDDDDDLSNRAAAQLRLRLRSHQDRPVHLLSRLKI